MVTRRIVGIGGGSVREKTTLGIDRFIRDLCPKEKPYALFFPTASHDSKPYFNSFRKIYCSNLNCHTEVALLTRDEMTLSYVEEKINLADIIYVGGGDTEFMLDLWRSVGIDRKIIAAYERGAILCGLSAGFICWFDTCYSDYQIVREGAGEFVTVNGLGIIEGTACPHYNLREKEFDREAAKFPLSYAVQDNAAIYFENEKFVKSVSAGGKAFRLTAKDGVLQREEL